MNDASDIVTLIDAIREHVAARPALVRSVAASFQFRLRDPEFAFVIDLKSAPGTVREGVAERADCTLELQTRDFFALQRGDVLGRALYLTGALKMTGKTGLASHLDFLREVGKREPAVAPAAEPSFDALVDRIRARAAQSSQPVSVTLRVGEATCDLALGTNPGAPACTLSLDPAALVSLASGERSVVALYMRGAIRIEGDIAAARALDRALTGAKGKG